jgi:hypothetical protein
MHSEPAPGQPLLPEAAPCSLPECLSALLERLAHGSGGPTPVAAPGSGALGHFEALDVLEQEGCSAEWRYGRIEHIEAAHFPLILQYAAGAYCVLLSPPRAGKVRVLVHPATGQVCECGADTIQSVHGATWLLCQPSPEHQPDAAAAAPHWYFGALVPPDGGDEVDTASRGPDEPG